MELTRSLVESKAEEYAAEEPLYAVEAEQVRGLPAAFATGDFGWRDAEWVVRWHYRRYLGAIPNDRRRAAEGAFGENEYEAVQDALVAAAGAADPLDALDDLTALSGVDVPVASAFLLFLDPEANLVVGEREWTVLHAAGELEGSQPDPIGPADYGEFLDAGRAVGDRLDVSMWTLYRALWRLWKDEFG
ncbi:MAG: hypothetical protein ABEJ92_07165 [Halobacteriales archaeon]